MVAFGRSCVLPADGAVEVFLISRRSSAQTEDLGSYWDDSVVRGDTRATSDAL